MLDSQDKKELAEVERRLNDTFVYDDCELHPPKGGCFLIQ